jgi:hypothetical protein
LALAAGADSTIDPGAPYAWGENIGWVNFQADVTHGAVVTSTSVSGYAWCENVGWLNLGDGANTDPGGFGIIHDGAGNLSGYAWGENIGWVNFDTSGSGGSQVTIDGAGQFNGYAWGENVGWIALNSGQGVITALPAEGEGVLEGEGLAEGEGLIEGEGLAEGEGLLEGEGLAEGEGLLEGEGEGTIFPDCHAADQDCNGVINLTELLRVIQFFNIRGYHCVTPPDVSEDGYLPGSGTDYACVPHASDYLPQDWAINLTELLRLIQFFNIRGYHACPGLGTEDGYCPGL